MKELCESAGLFEVNVPDYKQLKACRKSVKGLACDIFNYTFIHKNRSL